VSLHRTPAALISSLILLLVPTLSWAAWLDADAPARWHARAPVVPPAPHVQGNDDPRCRETERPAETAEDRQVTAKGWRLFHDYQGGWNVKVIWALSGYDGMCRAWGYQAFVFVGSAFAGTLSPDAMNARTDASLFSVQLTAPRVAGDLLVATFQRYADSDPLCCPSRRTLVRYRIDHVQGAPVIVPVAAATSPIEP
jgi:LppP/LprE lipoprotein